MDFETLRQILQNAQVVLAEKTDAEASARATLNVARAELLAATQSVANAEKALLDFASVQA